MLTEDQLTDRPKLRSDKTEKKHRLDALRGEKNPSPADSTDGGDSPTAAVGNNRVDGLSLTATAAVPVARSVEAPPTPVQPSGKLAGMCR